MIQSLNGIMIELERQKAAIERALAALREVGATITTAQIEPAVSKRKRFSAKVRRKMALAQKARWAKAKNEIEPPAPPTAEVPKPKRRISAQGMKRIIAATKKRWRLQKAAAKSARAKKAVPKKGAAAKKEANESVPSL